jgi:hypothetical protein
MGKNTLGGACSRHGGNKNACKILVEKPEGKNTQPLAQTGGLY